MCYSESSKEEPHNFWDHAEELISNDKELTETLRSLKEAMKDSKAPSTAKAYSTWERKFATFCEDHELSALPAEDLTVALFLRSLNLSSSACIQAAASIKWMHEREMERDPTNNALVRQLLQAEKRIKPGTTHKEPATEKHLTDIRDYYNKHPTKVNLRTLVLSVLAYAGCMRMSDFIKLKRGNLCFQEDKIKLYLPNSKTDQLREGALKVIAKAPNPSLCPVDLLKLWVQESNISDPNQPLFPMLTSPENLSP